MIREILKYPNSTLRKKAEKVREINDEIKKLAQDMIETMVVNQGVGLAATQIGVLKRIIIVAMENGPQIFINPKIKKKSQETILEEEGCLSFPNLYLKIKRAKEIEIEAQKENDQKICLKVVGLPARIFQHEIDHLDGILFIDRISFWQKLKLRKNLKTFQTWT